MSSTTKDRKTRKSRDTANTSISNPKAAKMLTTEPFNQQASHSTDIHTSQMSKCARIATSDNSDTKYLLVHRGWPTHPALGTSQYGHPAIKEYDAAWTLGLGPIDRWKQETSGQSPWNNTAAVAAVEETEIAGLEETLTGGESDEVTDAGSW